MAQFLKELISHFLMNVSSFPSYGVYISQLIHFARVCSNVGNVNEEIIFFNSNHVYTLKSVLKWFRVGNYQGQ